MHYASVRRRTIAFVLDMVLIGVVWYGCAIISAPHGSRQFFEAHGLALFLVLSNSYFVVLEALCGATLGKFTLGLRVVRLDGGAAGWGGAMIRQALRLVDGQFAHLVGRFLISITARHQRFGDLIAGTIVIRTQSRPYATGHTKPPEFQQNTLGR
jgi:uncharacterized RDD family membrane protein YckC